MQRTTWRKNVGACLAAVRPAGSNAEGSDLLVQPRRPVSALEPGESTRTPPKGGPRVQARSFVPPWRGEVGGGREAGRVA